MKKMEQFFINSVSLSKPRVALWVITYACQGLKIKGMLAEPKEKRNV